MVVEFIDETGEKIAVVNKKLSNVVTFFFSGKPCLIMCEVFFFFFYGSKPGDHFARNLREFGVARSQELEMNQ